jgi:plasmid stabilization system protein ParE
LKLLLIQRQARRDLQEATAWYRERNPAVAERFVAEVERTFELIERFPATGARIPTVVGPARRLPVNGFPYHVVFEEFQDRIEVLAVAHDRRRPGYWTDRI